MAEFVEVFKATKRMCKHSNCAVCPLSENGFECMAERWSEMEPDKFERIVMDWAKEHPEPVYPTWLEWMVSEGIMELSQIGIGKTLPKADKPIPADIAEKLGLEPKDE